MQKFSLSYTTQRIKTAMISLLIFGILFPLIGMGLCVDSFSPIPTPVDISSISPEEIEPDSIYKADDLYVVDVYAEYTETERFTKRVVKVEKQYFLCMLFIDDTAYMISIQTKPTDDVMTRINAYLNDDEQGFGDLSVNGYFKADKLTGEVKQFYDEAVEFYDVYGLGLTPLQVNLVYECDGNTDYGAFAAEQQQQQRLISLVFVGIGMICLAGSCFARRTYKKQLAAEAEKARSWTTEEE